MDGRISKGKIALIKNHMTGDYNFVRFEIVAPVTFVILGIA